MADQNDECFIRFRRAWEVLLEFLLVRVLRESNGFREVDDDGSDEADGFVVLGD